MRSVLRVVILQIYYFLSVDEARYTRVGEP